MNRASVQAAAAVSLTLILLAVLLVSNPVGAAKRAIIGSVPSRPDTRASFYFVNPDTQEVSNGQNPLASLRRLEPLWCARPMQPRYILSGNSQTMTVIFAPSETPDAQPARTYPDYLLDQLTAAGYPGTGYRLSAPNISYMEVLWYLTYLAAHPCLQPTDFVVQLNFETFRKTGVRDGMLELLEDPAFATSIEGEARSPGAHAGVLQQAIDRYRSRVTMQTGAAAAGAGQTSNTGVAESEGIGGLIETRIRALLDQMPSFSSRGVLKAELLDILYLARVKLLGISPSTKRSLGGGTLTANVSALERIAEVCRHAGIRLVFFNAPQNPDAPLYRTPADREQYERLIARLGRDRASAYFDFEDSIPGPLWGAWVDGPDPIHFGPAAHRRLASLMFQSDVIVRAH